MTEEALRQAAIAGWNACRKQVYRLSEHLMDETHPLKSVDTVAGNFYRGQYDVAKSFGKAFNSFEAEDCDEFKKIAFPIASSSIIPATKGGEEPATMYQMAEERLCTCGAAGSGEGHVDWCDWQLSEWRKWGEAYAAAAQNDAIEVLTRAAKIVIAAFDGMQPHHLPHNGERALALLGQALAALAQDTVATPPVAQTGTVGTHRHLKSGHLVRVIGVGRMQAANWRTCPFGQGITSSFDSPVDMREVVIYEHDGNLWARPVEEFNDGRFEALSAPTVEGEAL